MVQIIAGKKGKGKTKHLLDMANAAIKGANGTVVYRQLLKAGSIRGCRHF